MTRLAFSLLVFVLSGCVGFDDSPDKVIDLRVLGIQMEPPELFAPTCEPTDASTLTAFSADVQFRALVADPKGEGRGIAWELWACASPGDRTCSDGSSRVLVQYGVTQAGEITHVFRPGTLLMPNGQPLLERVLAYDGARGLGGIRLPLVLRLKAEEEEIYAMKLMVFGCPFFPEMKANVTPNLPGLLLEDELWLPEVPKKVTKASRIRVEDFSTLEESYLVPSFELKPVPLKESWKISWHTDFGSMQPGETGGTDEGGFAGLHRVTWNPKEGAEEPKRVTVWAVVRDGRGGMSWLTRKLRYLAPGIVENP